MPPPVLLDQGVASMPICYFVPGFGGTELWATLRVWLSYSDVIFGKFGTMELSANGVTPGGPDGAVLHVPTYQPDHPAAQFLSGYYERIIDCLRQYLAPHGYTTQPWAYDWRLDCRATGNRLANDIRMAVKPDAPCSIVAHSMGGIIARRAWWDLGQTNQSNLIRRIVTIGTPHQGSYSAIRELWGPDGTVAEKLWRYNNVIGTAVRFRGKILYYKRWSTDDIANLFLTWPAFYQLFPMLGGIDSSFDPNRAAIFDAANWRAGLTPSAARLTDTRDNWQSWLRSPASLPPTNVLVTVAGLGSTVPTRLQVRTNIAQDGSLYFFDDGDGTVPTHSAWLTGYTAHALAAQHGDVCSASTINNAVISWVLDEPAAPPAPPSPNPTAGQQVMPPQSEWPAWFNGTAGQVLTNRCVNGNCSC